MDLALVVLAAVLVFMGAWAAVEHLRKRRGPASYVPAEQARTEVVALAARGEQIRAVKVLRERSGLGLREAVETVRRRLE